MSGAGLPADIPLRILVPWGQSEGGAFISDGPMGDNISVAPYSSTTLPVMWAALTIAVVFGSGSGKTERGLLIAPGERQT